MSIMESIGRIGVTLISIVQTRVELAAVEMEEESQRLLRYLLLVLLALFLFGMATVLLTFLVVLLFWDNHRIEAVLGLAALFGIAGASVAMTVRAQLAAKPRMLGHTLAELHKDIELVKTMSAPHEQ